MLTRRRQRYDEWAGWFDNEMGVRPGAVSTPQDIYGLALWLDAADATTLFQESTFITPATVDTNPVGGWRNKATGSSVHAIQATAGLRPILKTAIINGLNVVRFDGTDDRLTMDGLASLFSGTDQPFSMVMVAKKIGNVGNGTYFSFSRSSSVTPLHLLRTNTTVSYGSVRRDDANTLSNLTAGTPDTTAHVLAWVFTGTAVTLHIDGTSTIGAAQDVGAMTVDQVDIGAVHSITASDFANMDVGEVILASTALSDADRIFLQGYLKTRWGTP